MKQLIYKGWLFLPMLLMIFICFGCSGTGSSSGGIGGSGFIVKGSVSAHGSIVVNGIAYDTSGADIIVDGETVGIGDTAVADYLDVGKIVTIYGSNYNDTVADRITYSKNILGPVESIDVIDAGARKDIVVLGQAVILNVVTVFQGLTFEDIALNDVVEISGFMDENHVVWATYIEKTDEVIFRVTGFVANLDSTEDTFDINHLTINYASADLSGLPGGEPSEGLFVEVEGSHNGSDEMNAAQIALGDRLEVEDADIIEMTGFVTSVDSAFEFTIGNQLVQTDGETVFIDGTANNISPGQKIEAEGVLENGVLLAEEIEFWEPNQIEIEGLVTDASSAPDQFTVGTQIVQTDALTVFEPADLNIEINMNIEVKGVPSDVHHSLILADKVSLEVE